MDDGLMLLASGAALLSLVLGIEWLHRRMGLSASIGRRVVHVATGLFVVAMPMLFSSPAPVYVLATAFVILILLGRSRGWFSGMHEVNRESLGTVTFPIALIVSLWWGWPDHVVAIQVSFLVLAFADPMAAWVGQRWGARGTYRLGGDPRTLTGSVAFFLTTFAVVALGLLVFKGSDALSTVDRWIVVSCVAAVATWAEALGRKGWDNLWIVVAVLVTMTASDRFESDRLAIALIVGVAFPLLAFRMKLLDAGGAAVAGLLAVSVIWLGGWMWLLPGAAFFVLSSLLSRLPDRNRVDLTRKHGPRDAAQVLANGGVAWVILLQYHFTPEPWLYAAYVAAFAAAAADTWSTEIGSRYGGVPIMLRNGARAVPGTSGAVTFVGFLAAAGGSLSVVVVASWSAGPWPGIILAGWLGALMDSVIGATAQGRFFDPETNTVVEFRPPGSSPVSGWAWIDNDRVNLICTLTGAFFGGAIWVWLV